MEALRAIGERSSASTRVGLLSYPYLETTDDFTIQSLLPPHSYRAGEAIRTLGRRGDELQTRAVDAANSALRRRSASFVTGVKDRFAGHEPDGNLVLVNLQGWLHELLSPIPAEWYHPNLIGHEQYARHLLESITFSAASFR